MSETSILPKEADHFGAMAADWWDPDGSSSMLHKLNPVRLKYVRDQADRHWQSDECSLRPLEGKRALMAVDLINGRVLVEGLVLGQ